MRKVPKYSKNSSLFNDQNLKSVPEMMCYKISFSVAKIQTFSKWEVLFFLLPVMYS